MFEYLATGLPIGFVADLGSATETALREVPQAVDLRLATHGLMDRAVQKDSKVPSQYAEGALAGQFRKSVLA